jgi:hypothetical protein
MNGNLLPEHYVNIPKDIVYGIFPSGEFQTYARIRGLAKGKSETQPVSVNQLSQLFNIPVKTLYGHMKSLRDRGALRWRSAQDHTIIVSFPVESDTGIYSEISESPNEEEPVLKRSIKINDPLPLLNNSSILDETINNNFSKDAIDNLRRIGVYEKLIPDILNSGWNENQIKQTINELESHGKLKSDISSILVWRIKNCEPPKDPTDRNKYIVGPYADIIHH